MSGLEKSRAQFASGNPQIAANSPGITLGQGSGLSFGGNNGLLAQQLQAGGLLGAVGNPASFYKPVSMPLIETPGQLQTYLHSLGLPYQGADGKDVAPPTATATGGTTPTTTTKPTTKPTTTGSTRRGWDR